MSTLLKFSGLALIYVANAKDFVTFDELDGIAASPQKMFNDQDSKLHKFELQSAKQGWEGFIKKLKHPGPLLSVCSGKTGPELNQCYDQNGLRGDKVIALRSKIEKLKSDPHHGPRASAAAKEIFRLSNYVADTRNRMRAASSASTCCRDASEMNGDNANYCMGTWDNFHQAGFRCVYRCHTGPGVTGADIMPNADEIPEWGEFQDQPVENIMHTGFGDDISTSTTASQFYLYADDAGGASLDAGTGTVDGAPDPAYMPNGGIYTTEGLDNGSPGNYAGVAANIDNGRDQLCLYREGTDTGKDVTMVWHSLWGHVAGRDWRTGGDNPDNPVNSPDGPGSMFNTDTPFHHHNPDNPIN